MSAAQLLATLGRASKTKAGLVAMTDREEIDGLVGDALVRARQQNVADDKARVAMAAPEFGASLQALRDDAPPGEGPFVPVPLAQPQRRPAPPSERADQATAAPARLAQGALVPVGRKKVELNLPPEPELDGPRGPEDIVVSEPFQKLPEARSRHAKTDLRMRSPTGPADGVNGWSPTAEEARAIAEAKAYTAAQGGATPGARTVGGRTERLGPVVGARAAQASTGELNDPGRPTDRAVATDVLARTLGGRTERHLPAAGAGAPVTGGAAVGSALPMGTGPGGSEPPMAAGPGGSEPPMAAGPGGSEPPTAAGSHGSQPPLAGAGGVAGPAVAASATSLGVAAAGAPEAGVGPDGSPWRGGAGAEVPDELLPSSLRPSVMREPGASDAPAARSARSQPPASHAAEQLATRRRNRLIVGALAVALMGGALILAVLGSGDPAADETIDVATGRDRVPTAPADATDEPDEPAPAASDSNAPASPQPDAGSGGAAPKTQQPSSASGRPPAKSATAAVRPAGSPPAAGTAAPKPVTSSGSPGLFFEKGGG